MIESSRNNDSRYVNKYGNNYANHMMANYNNNDYYNNPDDEPLDNYLAVEDADMINVDKSFGIGNDYYYTGN